MLLAPQAGKKSLIITQFPFNNHFSAGQQVKVEWKGSWWDALIREVSENQYLIHYIGFDSSWDEWITVERMKNN